MKTDKAKVLKRFVICWVILLVINHIATVYFGNNWTPQSTPEKIIDGALIGAMVVNVLYLLRNL